MKRILIVSNDGLSNSSSNGRTMKQLLSEYDKSLIYQFCLHAPVDEEMCQDAYIVSDKRALKAIYNTENVRCSNNTIVKGHKAGSKPLHIKRSCRNMMLREFVWRSYRWWTGEFTEWLLDVHPDVVVFQAGDSPFMCTICYKIIKLLHVPLLIYNSESYVIRDALFHGAKVNSLSHRFVKRQLSKQYARLMSLKPFCVYIIEELEDAYQEFYPHPGRSITIRTASSFERIIYTPENNDLFTVSYCGNLGGGRAELLFEVSKTLEKLCQTAKLIVCGGEIYSEGFNSLISQRNVDYRGMVSYEEVCNIIKESDLVLHCESDERLDARRYGFSTKIADCLACGIPFLVVTSKEYYFAQYLIRNDAAFVCEPVELSDTLKSIIYDSDYRCSKLKNAHELWERNHNPSVNASIVKQIIEGL